MTKQKTRVSYDKSLRQEAKTKGVGLATIAITFPDGTRLEKQDIVDALECQFIKWASVLLFNEEAKLLPDLQELIKDCIKKGERRGKKEKRKK